MENVITQESPLITQEESERMTTRWAEEDVLKIAQNFHKLERSRKQFFRAKAFVLTDMYDFNLIRNIKTFKVFLGLNAGDKEEITFHPIFEIKQESGEVKHFVLKPEVGGVSSEKETAKNSEIVPGIFKETVSKNWDDVDVNLIDDLFVATVDKRKKRVLHFDVFNKDIIKYINSELELGNITGVTLYPGIDMNKFQYKDTISFTPVIGFKTKNTSKSLSNKGLIEFTKDEIFVEYLRPCPPTCVSSFK